MWKAFFQPKADFAIDFIIDSVIEFVVDFEIDLRHQARAHNVTVSWLLCGRVLLEGVLEHGAGTATQWRFFLPGGRNRNDCWLYYLSIASKTE